ncbi:MAG: WbqC family protein [Nonlabens sp.]
MTLYPSYFCDIISLCYIYDAENLVFEKHGNFVKQTYRNRCYIAGPNGKQSLNIPTQHTGKGQSVSYAAIEIDHSEPWSTNHLKSIKSAYNSSPFYQFYEDDLNALFEEIPINLYDWNLKTIKFVFDHIGLEKGIHFTQDFANNSRANRLITAKGKAITTLDKYIQVFQEKHGFIQPLSGLDLLFNLGPSAMAYLKCQQSKLPIFS